MRTVGKLLFLVVILLGMFFVFMYLGRPREGLPIHFKLPAGFKGFVEVVEDRKNGQQPIVQAGEIVLRPNYLGLVVVDDFSFLESFHEIRASYPDGTNIPAEADPGVAMLDSAVFGLGSKEDSEGRQGIWWLVGTQAERESAFQDRDSWVLGGRESP